MKNNWIGFVAVRYVSRGRKISASSVFSVLGIAVGVLALTVILSVMNGFQLGFIESILEMSSGHIRVLNFPTGVDGDELIQKFLSAPPVRSALPFRETSVLLRGRFAAPRGALIRGVLPNVLELDHGLRDRLTIEDGFFDLQENNSIVLGAELARSLGVRVGGSVSLLSVPGTMMAHDDEDADFQYLVTGIFRCGFYEYDLGWAFINIEQAEKLDTPGHGAALEIKLNNRWHDRQAISALELILGGDNAVELISWRDYNRAFFGALRTEKLFMFILVGLIFIVVGMNIFQSQRRLVLERQEEIGLLKALGAPSRAVRLVFISDGFIMGAIGAGLGLGLGLLISFNIPEFFSLMESMVNGLIRGINFVAGFVGIGGMSGEFSIFSPQVFYIKEIPSRVIPQEVFVIFLFGFLSAIAAAWTASMRVSRTKPAEVLRYE